MNGTKMWSRSSIRTGLVEGRIRLVDARGASPLVPTFDEALALATIDDLQYIMALFVDHPRVKRTWRKRRMRAMAERMVELARHATPPGHGAIAATGGKGMGDEHT